MFVRATIAGWTRCAVLAVAAAACGQEPAAGPSDPASPGKGDDWRECRTLVRVIMRSTPEIPYNQSGLMTHDNKVTFFDPDTICNHVANYPTFFAVNCNGIFGYIHRSVIECHDRDPSPPPPVGGGNQTPPPTTAGQTAAPATSGDCPNLGPHNGFNDPRVHCPNRAAIEEAFDGSGLPRDGWTICKANDHIYDVNSNQRIAGWAECLVYVGPTGAACRDHVRVNRADHTIKANQLTCLKIARYGNGQCFSTNSLNGGVNNSGAFCK